MKAWQRDLEITRLIGVLKTAKPRSRERLIAELRLKDLRTQNMKSDKRRGKFRGIQPLERPEKAA